MNDGDRPSRAHTTTNGDPAPGCRRLPALGLAVALLALGVAAASGASASSGGISSSGGATIPEPPPFGSRVLRVGMEGNDVAVLNGIVRSKRYGARVRLGSRFLQPTSGAVRMFQQRKDLRPSGVVTRATAEELTSSMRLGGATWYGPGFYGNRTACGPVLRVHTIGVAHRTLPCGTKVTFAHRGRYAIAAVIDRGPYTRGNEWDLTNGLRKLLAFNGSGQIRYAVAR